MLAREPSKDGRVTRALRAAGRPRAGAPWAARARPRQSIRLFGQLSWVSISFVDCDLVSQDFSLVLVPGMRLAAFLALATPAQCRPLARRRGAFGARLETLVGAGSDGGAGRRTGVLPKQ